MFTCGAAAAWNIKPATIPQPDHYDSLLNAVVELNSKPRNMQEYQIRLEQDSAYVYDNGRYIGSCAHDTIGIDSVIRKDNL
jgi:hypothetical protein